jgi:glycosyltransferase XagB
VRRGEIDRAHRGATRRAARRRTTLDCAERRHDSRGFNDRLLTEQFTTARESAAVQGPPEGPPVSQETALQEARQPPDTLGALIRSMIGRNLSPTAGLREFRESGGRIRNERWYATWRELQAEPGGLPVSVSADESPTAQVRPPLAVDWNRQLPPAPGAERSPQPAPAVEQSAAESDAHAPRSRRVSRTDVVLLASLAAAAAVLYVAHTWLFLYLVYIGVSLLMGAICSTTLVWMLHAWRSPESLAETHLARDDRTPLHSFSLIVPARNEESVLETTLTRLVQGDHPAFEVLVVVGDDDPGTRTVAERVAARHPGLVRVIVDSGRPKNKPKALNAALPYAHGAITGVFDAEDDVHPGLLMRVDQCFQRTDADVVQAGVQLMNFRSSWFAVRNVLEYYFWFRSRLHFHARQGFIPLGGNTVFVRTKVLRAVGGWDPECLAEDCELGVRLSALGARTVVVYEPELVTREETPPTLAAFTRQRTRWNQGFLQTLFRGYWRRLPIRQQALGVYTLAMPYLMALAWLLIPVAIATAVSVKAPVPVTLISMLPALPMLSILAVEVAGLKDFCRTYGERPSTRDYARLVLGLPVYQFVLAFAAAWAVAREALGARSWEKTAHFGLHLARGSDGARRRAPGRRWPVPWARVARRHATGSAELAQAAQTGQALGLTGFDRTVTVYADEAPTPRVIDWAEDGLLRDLFSGLSREGSRWSLASNVNGDGRAGPPSRPDASLVPAAGHEPLWLRLGICTDGSASPPLPRIRLIDLSGAERWPRGAPARLSRLVASHLDLAVQVPLLTLVGLVQATNMLHWPGVLFDEGTYVVNAWAVGEKGVLAPYTFTYGHPPLGWITISLWTWAGGLFGHATYSIDGAREFMLAVSIVSCSLLYTLARRLHIGRAFAAGAVILFALSPLSLFFHRGVLLDNPAVAWVLAAFVLALTPRRRLWAFAGSGACFAAGVLSKETTLILLPALLLAAAQNADRRTRRYCLTLFGSFFVLIGAAYPLYAALKGELLPGQGHVSLLGYTGTQLFSRKTTGNVFDPDSLAHGIVQGWLHLDPWLLGAALALSPLALARRSTRAVAVAYLIQAAMILRPGYLPGMYVIALLPFAALLVAGTVEALWRGARGDVGRLVWPGRRTGHAKLPRLSRALVRFAAVAMVVASAVVVVHIVAPRWKGGDRAAMTTRLDGAQRAVERWLVRNVGHDERLIVTDDIYLYLVEHGFDTQPVTGGFYSRTVVSYWPLDFDPAVKRYFPNGWRDFDYIVSTEGIRDAVRTDVPTSFQALTHSRVVARFGRGAQRFEVREISEAYPQTTPGEIPRPFWLSDWVHWRLLQGGLRPRPARVPAEISEQYTWIPAWVRWNDSGRIPTMRPVEAPGSLDRYPWLFDFYFEL